MNDPARAADAAALEPQLRAWLAEDVGPGDLTTEALVAAERRGVARILAKEAGVLAGFDLVLPLVRLLDPTARCVQETPDGARVEPGQVVGMIEGRARALLTAERTALNLLQRMSGIATLTARYVAAVAGTGAVILETRKTAPGLRLIDKRAVRAGGGQNHRMGLHDEVLIKENHLDWMEGAEGGRRPIERAVQRARSHAPKGCRIIIEVIDGEEALRAAEAGADVVLLDNFRAEDVRVAVQRLGGRPVLLEASGGLTLDNVRAYAETGVQRLSIGALTHSVRALDLTLLVEAG